MHGADTVQQCLNAGLPRRDRGRRRGGAARLGGHAGLFDHLAASTRSDLGDPTVTAGVGSRTCATRSPGLEVRRAGVVGGVGRTRARRPPRHPRRSRVVRRDDEEGARDLRGRAVRARSRSRAGAPTSRPTRRRRRPGRRSTTASRPWNGSSSTHLVGRPRARVAERRRGPRGAAREREAAWEQRSRWMSRARSTEPRLTAEHPVIADAPQPVLRYLAGSLSAPTTARAFSRLWMNWYRDHRDGTGLARRPAGRPAAGGGRPGAEPGRPAAS